MDEVEPRIRELLQAYPTDAGDGDRGADRLGRVAITVLRDRVAELRPVYLPPDPASRTGYVAGEIAQCDLWFPPIELPVGFGQARRRDAAAGADDGHRLLAVAVGGADPVPVGGGSVRRLVAADRGAGGGAAGAGLGRGGRDRPVAGRPGRADRASARRSAARWAPRWWSASPADPEAKGLIERAHDYLETLVPARPAVRLPADFNTQLRQWLALVNTRARRALGCAPTDRIAADRQAMLALPPVRAGDGYRS